MSTISVNNLVNVIASPTALVVGTATNNPLLFQTNNVLAATVDINQNLILSGTGFFGVPRGTTSQRPGSPQQAALRFNTTLVQLELYDGASWVSSSIGFTSGAGAPSGSTAVSPPFYVDVSTAPRNLYFYSVGAWNLVTPPTASQTVSGIARLATSAEAIAGTSTGTTISPATLRASVNSNYIGVIATAPAFTPVVQLDCVRYSNGTFLKATAGTSPGNLAVGFADVTNLTLVTSGVLGGFTGLVQDSAYFLSASTAGAITNIAPSDSIRVGTAVSTTQLLVRVSSGGGAATGGGGVTKTITQAAHGFVVGSWLYHNGTTYIAARADLDSTSDVVGVVTVVTDSSNFTLTSAGYVTGLSGLSPGNANYLSISVAGALQTMPPTAFGQIEKPLLIADSATSGFVAIMRGSIIGSGSSGVTKPIVQNSHGFSIGNWVYHNGVNYQLARADIDATSDALGVVSFVTDANNFTLTVGGFVSGLSGLTAGSAHRISPTVAGAIQIAAPTVAGQIDKPVFMADTSNSGYVIIMRANAVVFAKPIGAVGGSTDQIFFENDQIVTTNYTLAAGKNAGTFGPTTINTGASVTVPDGATWSIV